MLHLADSRLAPRQVIAMGRVSERVTGRGLGGLQGALTFRTDGGTARALPARFEARGEGYCAFSVIPGRDMPDLSGATTVTLRAEYRRGGAAPVVVERTVPGSALAVQAQPRTVAGQPVEVLVMPGAPFDLSAEVDPAPVALSGIVIRDHDPSEPVANVSVAAGPASAVTDAGGRFLISPLPLVAEVVLDLTEGATTTQHPYRIDYARPVNTATLSLP